MVTKFVFVLVALTNFPEMLMENDIKNCQCYCKKQIDKKFPWLELMVHLSIDHTDVISMVDKIADHEKLRLIC